MRNLFDEPRVAMLAAVVACLATGMAWGIVVPPFEAPDEIHNAQIAYDWSKGHPSRYDPAFFVLAAPLLNMLYDPGVPFQNAGIELDPTRNPLFSFIGNQPARVNMFVDGRNVHIHGVHTRRLYFLRALALAISTLSILAICVMGALAFGQWDIGMLVAGLCVFVPQFSFMSAKAHPEVMSTLVGALVNLVLVARATGRLSRTLAWVALVPLLCIAPFTDNAAFFLLPFSFVGMIIAADNRRERQWTAGLMAAAGGLCVLGVFVYVKGLSPEKWQELETTLRQAHLGIFFDAGRPLGDLLAAPDTGQYLIFEFWPKMFMGFWGWIGQPSILLPAGVYAALATLGLCAGLGLWQKRARGSEDEAITHADRALSRVLVIALAGLLLSLLPIVVAALVWNRNEWYGRWLFPMIGPIMIVMTGGLREFIDNVRKQQYRMAAFLGIAGAIGLLLWFGPPGELIRAGITANHYGDQARLIRFVRDTVVAVALVPLVIAAVVFARTVWASRSVRARTGSWPMKVPAAVFGVAFVLNWLLLFAFIRPLYQPLDERGYAAAVREEAGRGAVKRAADLARIALEEYPGSSEFFALGTSVMLRGGDCDGLRRHFAKNPVALSTQEINHRNLLTLARAVRVCGVPLKENPAATRLIDALRSRADTREERDLLQMEMGIVPDMGADFVKYVRAAPAANRVRDDAVIEGMTTHVGEQGRHEFVIYFRPLSDWRGRRLWAHAYPPGSRDYVDVAADFPAFPGWRKDELAWEVFQTPDARPFNTYVGVAMGDDLGPAVPLGVVGGK